MSHRHIDIDILYLFTPVKRRQPEADVALRLQFLMNMELKEYRIKAYKVSRN